MTENEREGLEVVRQVLARGWADNDEAREVAMWGLGRALMRYDRAHGAPFGVFARRCIRQELSRWYRRAVWRGQWVALAHEADAADLALWEDAPLADAALVAAIAGLSLTRQKYIEAVWIRGETHEECARVMGVTPQAVSAGLARARLQLQKLLGPRADGLSPSERLDPEDSYQP